MTDDQLKMAASSKYCISTKKIPIVEQSMDKQKLDDSDRQLLRLYLDSHTVKNSIRHMKQEIFQLIGYENSNSSPSVVSHSDLEAIHNFIMSIMNGDTNEKTNKII